MTSDTRSELDVLRSVMRHDLAAKLPADVDEALFLKAFDKVAELVLAHPEVGKKVWAYVLHGYYNFLRSTA